MSFIGIIVVFCIIAIMMSLFYFFGGLGNSLPRSTIQRTKLESGQAVDVGWFTDELGWIGNSSTLISGLNHFYERTGVKPFLYITDRIAGQSPYVGPDARAMMSEYAEDLYDTMFRDEAHILVVFYEAHDEYLMWYVNGRQADAVMDSEAVDILFSSIESWYYRDVNEDVMFSNAFRDAGNRIMSRTIPTALWIAIIVGIVVIVIVLVRWRKAAAAARVRELEETRRILESPLDTTSPGDAAEDLAAQYEE